MDKITKQMILLTINEMELDDLVSWIQSDAISIEEMTNSGLERNKLNAIQEALDDSPPLNGEDNEDTSTAIYRGHRK